MKRYILFLLAWLPLACLAAIPDVTLYIDVTSPNPQKFAFSVRAGNTPVVVVRCVTNLTTGGAYTGFGSGWTPVLNYFMSDAASAGVIIPGTLDPSTGTITFNTLTNSFPAQGTYFCEVYLNNGPTPKLTIGQGQLIVTRSPSSGSIGALNMSSIVNWDILVSRGTVPWAAGAEPVFFASAAYGIRSYDTNNWTTSYLDELLLRTQFNSTSGQVTTALGTLTTNLAGEVSRATNAEAIISNAYVAAIAVETSRATNAEAAVSNYVNTEVAVEATRATNAEAVLEGQIMAISVSSNTIFSYAAYSNGNSQVDVLASGLGVTATISGSLVTITVPTGIQVMLAGVRWDAVNNGSTFTLLLDGYTGSRLASIFQAYREDTGGQISGAQARMDMTTFNQLLVGGLASGPSACICQCRFIFL